MAKHFEDFGMTRECARCARLAMHDQTYKKGHSQQCRDRIVAEFAKTADGQARIAAANRRKDDYARQRNKFIGCRNEPDSVQENGCDDRPCPKRFCVDAFHKGTAETPGSLAGSSTNAGSSSQASKLNCSAKGSTSDCSATEIKKEIEDVLMVDVSHSQPKEPQVTFREKAAGAPQERKEKNMIKMEKRYGCTGCELCSAFASCLCSIMTLAPHCHVLCHALLQCNFVKALL